jgi:DNA-binding transcriptional ArsR family regulator
MRPILCLRENVDVEMLVRLRGLLLQETQRLEASSERHALLGNGTRLAILWLIQQAQDRELCPCDLADILGLTVPAVSQQLQRLRRGGLVRNRRAGKTILYSLTPDGAAALSAPAARDEGTTDG